MCLLFGIDDGFFSSRRKIPYLIEVPQNFSDKRYYFGGNYKFYPGENMTLTEVKEWVIENISPSLAIIDNDHVERLTLKFSCNEDMVGFKLKWL